MFRQIFDPRQAKAVFETLTPHCEQCLYLYCNLDKYGVFSENFKVFLDEESGSVIGVYYGDSVHIFANHGIDAAIVAFIRSSQARTIFSSHPLTGVMNMDEETTGVYRLDESLLIRTPTSGIETLSGNDIAELTEFLYTNSEEYRKTYDKEKLREQLLERLESGYCRYFGRFDCGKLIGCAFTKAEIRNAMIVGGILVSPEHRGKGIGKALCLYKGRIAQTENKTAYCFIDDENYTSIKLHGSVGYRKVCTVHKYTIRK